MLTSLTGVEHLQLFFSVITLYIAYHHNVFTRVCLNRCEFQFLNVLTHLRLQFPLGHRLGIRPPSSGYNTVSLRLRCNLSSTRQQCCLRSHYRCWYSLNAAREFPSQKPYTKCIFAYCAVVKPGILLSPLFLLPAILSESDNSASTACTSTSSARSHR
jgi:hypothetical protein